MFAKRGLPTGVRKRHNAQDTEGEAPSERAVRFSDGSDEEHAKIVKKKTGSRLPCKHFLMGRTSDDSVRKMKATEALAQQSNRQLNLEDDGRATAVLDVDPDKSTDHRAILERNFKIGEMIEKGELESGIYRGMGAYRHYVKPSEGALSRAKSTGLYGPVRGSNNVRLTMYVDYKPEICKDYKETGYCGYGDCCKFLHDRTDYKEGWQVEKEWEELQKKRLEKLRRQAEGKEVESSSSSSSSSEESEDEDGLPFACLKCRERWRLDMAPVVTRCGHYYCEKRFRQASLLMPCYKSVGTIGGGEIGKEGPGALPAPESACSS
ncbi:zinc finger (ccch type) domain-containing protein [Cyclospora cayetanensis]|uniref:Zinc finger (Ccch type) domain-containing protein n=1 Tax=Cyclospora cayetanensis TaxID=88456 RepID=A0A1D3CSP7_9EIME|nr:zinc finger (ccch type) domain-containing protein [Cyclospora cayetanensis]